MFEEYGNVDLDWALIFGKGGAQWDQILTTPSAVSGTSHDTGDHGVMRGPGEPGRFP